MNTFALFLVGVGAGWTTDWLVHSFIINKKDAAPESEKGGHKHEHGHESESVEMEAEKDAEMAAAALETGELSAEPHQQADAPEEDNIDDLSLMKGVGPKLVESMNEIGIHTYHQLSKINADELYQQLQEVGARVVNKPSLSALAEQAKLAAKGDWDGLETLQKSL